MRTGSVGTATGRAASAAYSPFDQQTLRAGGSWDRKDATLHTPRFTSIGRYSLTSRPYVYGASRLALRPVIPTSEVSRNEV